MMRAISLATALVLAAAGASAQTPATPSYAIVAQDQTALRAGPRDSAPTQAVLWQGDVLEVRGQRLDYLQVYDHRRERAGYVLASQARGTRLKAEDAPDLLAVLRFVRDLPGSEALGLAYAAAYLKAAPAGTNTAEAWDAMGLMADRLAARASRRGNTAPGATPSPQDTQLAGQLEGLAALGVKLQGIERDNGIQLCYDGEAFGRVLAQAGAAGTTPEQTARALLGLTRLDCQDTNTTPALQHPQDLWRAQLLEQGLGAEAAARLPEPWKNRLQLRRASLWAVLAYQHSRQPDGSAKAQAAAQRAVDALAAINKAELSDKDQAEWQAAAVRVGASRWAALPAVGAVAATRPHIETRPGEAGETCVLLVDAQHGAKNPLHQRCTYGVVWAASASTHPGNKALALAVQPLASWRELWLYRQTADGWVLDVLPPGTGKPELGYAEFAGWVPGAQRMLVAREAQVDGRFKRSFEVLKLDTLDIDKQSGSPSQLALFTKWQDAGWKTITISLR